MLCSIKNGAHDLEMGKIYLIYLSAFVAVFVPFLPLKAQEVDKTTTVPYWPSSREEVLQGHAIIQDFGNAPIDGMAPFGDPDAEKPLMGNDPKSLLNLYQRNTKKRKTIDALGEPHKTPSQMSEWVVISVSDLLSFSSKDAAKKIGVNKGIFVGKAYNEYLQSLEKNNLKKLLGGKFVKINAVVEEDPYLLYEGVQGERYRWHYEFPVILTVFDRKTASHKSKAKETLRYRVHLEVARVSETLRLDGLLIEKWKMNQIR